MNKDRLGEYEKLEMLRALISARIMYFENKQGAKNYHQDIIDEYKMLENVVCAALNPLLREAIDELLGKVSAWQKEE
ncbi:hypothetical protein [uncultured Veillonella sp.]|uniref:hypothetical protein n=1 Tax=uncultured Veillonella sp. TaxID=159268 RepID=UPI0025DF7CFF|nr:hypothetical protein [uncultured Veillonella sp.]